jgi:trans-aconitate methyltransferase
MTQESKNIASEYRASAAAFQDKSVVEAYRYRPPYPASTFSLLTRLITKEPRSVLDVGCGCGDIARQLVEWVEQVDAVDFSYQMIEQGKQLPNGDHPRLHWIHGRIEEVQLQPPYALLTAGESLHWMDWSVVMPRFAEVLMEAAYLALVTKQTTPDPWSLLGEILPRYRTDRYVAQSHETQEHPFFQQVSESTTEPFTFIQSIDDVVESYHSRAGFSRERMEPGQAESFDQESKEALLSLYPNAMVTFQVSAHVRWGFPKKKA